MYIVLVLYLIKLFLKQPIKNAEISQYIINTNAETEIYLETEKNQSDQDSLEA